MNASDVSVIGLGAMGHALAQALVRGGQRVTVWNRTADKADALVREGATRAATPAAAIAASPVVLVCVTDYEAARRILEQEGGSLAGRVLVQLNTGTPHDAREAEVWARERGAEYLDGAILATPNQIGRADTPLFVSGGETAYKQSESVLKIVAGNLIYVGEAAGAASTWDLATLSCLFGAMFGFLHGARVFESEGLRVGDLGAMIARSAPVLGEMIRYTGDTIESERYERPQSSVKMCVGGFELFQQQAREAGINAEFPEFVLDLGRRGVAAGYGDEEFAAVIKILRNGETPTRGTRSTETA